jgi:hypothetical protein
VEAWIIGAPFLNHADEPAFCKVLLDLAFARPFGPSSGAPFHWRPSNASEVPLAFPHSEGGPETLYGEPRRFRP